MSPLDPNLLEKARSASAKVIDAEQELEIAKAEYNAEVRRLHLAGASLREIAAALGMSHQRVQQIVDAAGGSWWSKVWRNRSVHALRETRCSFCEKRRDEVAKLISGPDFCICDSCIARAEKALEHGKPHPPFRIASATDRPRCSFCGERQPGKRNSKAVESGTRPFVTGAARSVCSGCLEQCRQIVNETV